MDFSDGKTYAGRLTRAHKNSPKKMLLPSDILKVVCVLMGGGETTTFNEFFPPLTELCFKMIGKPVSRFFCEELMGAKKIESYFNSIKSYILV